MSVRLRVLYEGRVQGVGFRIRARGIATSFAVAGFVKNLADGRVELVVEGEPAEVSEYLEAIRYEFGGLIEGSEEQPVNPEIEALSGFAIRH